MTVSFDRPPPGGFDWTAVVRALGEGLARAGDFDAGAGVLLDALGAVLTNALASSGASLLRGLVHLRSESGGYRALVVSARGGSAAVAPSATVWSCVLKSGAVAVDLGTQKGVALRDGTPVELATTYVAPAGAASVQQMLARETSHLVALPLTSGPSGVPIGMAALELAWPGHVAEPWPDGDWRRDLTMITDLAAPRLAALPLGSPAHAEPEIDPLLPVMGEATRPIVAVLRVFVDQDETILISGPTGAGKSRLAEWCHQRSKRCKGPFELANLLAVPETMQMAELFGWKKGAFTGAHADHDGLVASSDGGTLFLDEIDKLSLAAQAGLLRVLETRRFAPLGATRERTVDVRFIVATNADLSELVRRGAFREDLYYRVNVLPVHLPPLSERRDEIGPWATAMLARRAPEHAYRLSPAALAALAAREWPGNLRQLENVVRRAYALHLATSLTAGPPPAEVQLDVVERALGLETKERSSAVEASTTEALARVAERLVTHALEARRVDRTLVLDELDVLRGAVLRAAIERVGSVKDAYLLFGGDALVRTRNHAAAYRRELALLEALEARLKRT